MYLYFIDMFVYCQALRQKTASNLTVILDHLNFATSVATVKKI